MEKMTYAEFNRRAVEIMKARKIFIPHITTNLTTAFEMYQELFIKEEERLPINISKQQVVRHAMTPIDDYVRPACPECGAQMFLAHKVMDMEGKLWETAWVCPPCKLEYYSSKTTIEWLDSLPKIGGVNKINE